MESSLSNLESRPYQENAKKESHGLKAQKVIRMIFAILIFGAGIAALFYPVFSDIWNQHRQNSMMDDYQDTVQQMTEEDYSA